MEIIEAIEGLIRSGRKVAATTVSGYWKDTGTVADLLEANRMVLEGIQPRRAGTVYPDSELIGRVVVEAGAQVTGSRIVGPAIIGANTVISEFYIGPFTSVAPDCVIADSEI